MVSPPSLEARGGRDSDNCPAILKLNWETRAPAAVGSVSSAGSCPPVTIRALQSPVGTVNTVLEFYLLKVSPTHDSPLGVAVTVWPRLLTSVQTFDAFPGPGSALEAHLLSVCSQGL